MPLLVTFRLHGRCFCFVQVNDLPGINGIGSAFPQCAARLCAYPGIGKVCAPGAFFRFGGGGFRDSYAGLAGGCVSGCGGVDEREYIFSRVRLEGPGQIVGLGQISVHIRPGRHRALADIAVVSAAGKKVFSFPVPVVDAVGNHIPSDAVGNHIVPVTGHGKGGSAYSAVVTSAFPNALGIVFASVLEDDRAVHGCVKPHPIPVAQARDPDPAAGKADAGSVALNGQRFGGSETALVSRVDGDGVGIAFCNLGIPPGNTG